MNSRHTNTLVTTPSLGHYPGGEVGPVAVRLFKRTAKGIRCNLRVSSGCVHHLGNWDHRPARPEIIALERNPTQEPDLNGLNGLSTVLFCAASNHSRAKLPLLARSKPRVEEPHWTAEIFPHSDFPLRANRSVPLPHPRNANSFLLLCRRVPTKSTSLAGDFGASCISMVNTTALSSFLCRARKRLGQAMQRTIGIDLGAGAFPSGIHGRRACRKSRHLALPSYPMRQWREPACPPRRFLCAGQPWKILACDEKA